MIGISPLFARLHPGLARAGTAMLAATLAVGALACAKQLPPVTVAGPPPDWRSAKLAFSAALMRAGRPGTVAEYGPFASQQPISGVRIGSDRFSFVDSGVVSRRVTQTRQDEPYGARRSFAYRDIPSSLSVGRYGFHPYFVEVVGDPIPAIQGSPCWDSCPRPGVRTDRGVRATERFHFSSSADADAFARALLDLVRAAAQAGAAEADFEVRAAAWRMLNPKPRLSEATNRARVLAEGAVRDRKYDQAIAILEDALDSDPTWSSGNYNLALLLAETGEYADAVRYMKRFLLLEPESREAPAAREKIILWESRAQA